MIWLNVVPHILIYLFADDAKLFKHIPSESDQEMLQEGVDELYKWTIEWLLNLNISKCQVIWFGRNVDKTHMYKIRKKLFRMCEFALFFLISLQVYNLI